MAMAEHVNAYRCLVVIPTFNERGNIAQLLGKILGADERLDVLVVDDSSPDGTAAAVREFEGRTQRVRLHQRDRKLGLGSAYTIGFETAAREGFGTICTMDGDLSHDPAHLTEMLKLSPHCDIVIGSRYVSGGKIEGFNIFRKVNSFVANALARRFIGQDVRDCTSGYRVYSTSFLQRVDLSALEAPGYSMLVELLYEARVRHARLAEHPIVFKNRVEGKSKVSYREVIGSLRTLLLLKLRQLKTRSVVAREKLEPSEVVQPLQ